MIYAICSMLLFGQSAQQSASMSAAQGRMAHRGRSQ